MAVQFIALKRPVIEGYPLDQGKSRISKLYQLSGYTVTPTAYKILCVRFVWFVRSISATPPQTQHSIPAVGYTLPDRDFHPARYTKLRLAL